MFRQQLFFLSLAALLLLSSCAPKVYKPLFYDYKLLDTLVLEFGDRIYNARISYDEIQNLPEPVKRYAIVSGLLNNQRITELFFDYKGLLYSSDYKVRLQKNFQVSDHVSAVDPIYDATGSSAPFFRIGSALQKRGSIYAQFFLFDLLSGVALDSAAITDICVLKYLSQMVWYPTAFINRYNLEWSKREGGEQAGVSLAFLSLSQFGFNASGTMYFSNTTGLPLHFTGTVAHTLQKSFSVSKVHVTYHNFSVKEGYYIPLKCVASIVNDENQTLKLEMELKRTLPVNLSKILNKPFMAKMKVERQKANAQNASYVKKMQRREARIQKRVERKAKRNKQ
jgi:hypothetical protein